MCLPKVLPQTFFMEKTNFIDYVKIYFKSGKGGAGSVHFYRDKFTRFGGPDGGNGGKGGSVILKGNSQMWTLLHLKYQKHISAQDGDAGKGGLKTGKDGNDIVIEVPLGTVAKHPETQEILGEITEHNQIFTLMSGGRGGMGNNFFKTPTHKTPRYAQPGEEGHEDWIILELKVLADVGLVGFPNAGKSTLLASVSAAKPEIADYPFTTLTPNLGIVPYHDFKSFIMADIPGIIQGAHKGKGLGVRFLRHIERNSVLLFTIPADTNDIKKEYQILKKECKLYNPELLNKKHLLAITKTDLIDAELQKLLIPTLPKKIPYVFISAVTQQGIPELKDLIWKNLNEI